MRTEQLSHPTSASGPASAFAITHLGPQHTALMHSVNTLFGQVFGDAQAYCHHRPRPEYLQRLLSRDTFVALATVDTATGEPVGALVAYELTKFEQERSEFYIYDLAVAAPHPRRGGGPAL